MPDPFKFELVSPERLLVSGEVEQVLVPGSEGDMTVLAYHAPLLTTLRPGVIEIGFPGGEQQRYFIRGGFAEVGPSGLTVLAETAIDLRELDTGQLAQAVKDAEDDVADATEDQRARPRPDQARSAASGSDRAQSPGLTNPFTARARRTPPPRSHRPCA